jgi:thiol-disulfide isomerase/thioredoxin
LDRGVNAVGLYITDHDFEGEVLKSDSPVVVDFSVPWCGPFHMLAPITEKLSEEYKGKLKFCKLNVDENPSDDYEIPGYEHTLAAVFPWRAEGRREPWGGSQKHDSTQGRGIALVTGVWRSIG